MLLRISAEMTDQRGSKPEGGEVGGYRHARPAERLDRPNNPNHDVHALPNVQREANSSRMVCLLVLVV